MILQCDFMDKSHQELSPGTAQLIKKFTSTFKNFVNLTLDEKRSTLDNIYMTDKPKTPVDTVDDKEISWNGLSIPIRIYHMNLTNRLPVVLYFHGGGWVLGSLDSQDALCRLIASRHECVVISVGYRLAPEHRYPAAIEDCLAVLEWTTSKAEVSNWDTTQIVLAGDSAGGNLAPVVSKLFRKKKLAGKIIHQILIYPVTDLSQFNTQSYQSYSTGYCLDKKEMMWFRKLYLTNENESSNPYVSPLLETDFQGYNQTTVITAGFDVLRDEGMKFYAKLCDNGVKTELINFDSLTHSFLRFTEYDENAMDAVSQIVEIIGSSWI